MAITAAMVKELREMTGAGMMDCKKALTETNGNMEEAVEFLRKNGQAKAEKKAGRIAAEGICRGYLPYCGRQRQGSGCGSKFRDRLCSKERDFSGFCRDSGKAGA